MFYHRILRIPLLLNYLKFRNFNFSNMSMSSPKEQPAKKIRLNSGRSVPSNDVISNSEDKIDDEQEIEQQLQAPQQPNTNIQTPPPQQSSQLQTSPVQKFMVREQDVGITEYSDPSIPGFSGVIKQRYFIY